MQRNHSNYMVVCIICGILTMFGIVANIIAFINGDNSLIMAMDIMDLVMIGLVVYYAFYGYRKPHGNYLKYLILIFAATHVISLYCKVKVVVAWRVLDDAIIIGLLCYISGRLHKLKQNMILMILVAVLIIVNIVAGYACGIVSIGIHSPLIIWIDICVAYILRYKEHKEAGLMDAEKK